MAAARVAALAQPALQTLRERLGLRTWIVAARDGDAWTPVTVLGASEAPPFPWAALCRRLARIGPLAAPRAAADDPELRAGPGTWRVGAYAGAPLRLPDGRVVGALVGADRVDRPQAVAAELPVVMLTGELLSAVLAAEVEAIVQARRAETAETDSRRDPLTGLGNRRSWDRLLVKEEERCRRQGLEAAVLVVDLDGFKRVNDELGHAAGDDLLRRTARTLTKHTRAPDDVARIGGDEFAIIAGDCPPDALLVLVARLRGALQGAGIEASLGAANREPEEGLIGAWAAADRRMYEDKRARR